MMDFVLENWGTALQSFVVIIGASVVFRLIQNASKKEPSIGTRGELILRMPKLYGIIGWVGTLVAAVIGIAGPIIGTDKPSDIYLIFGLIAFFVLLCIPLLLVSKNKKVEVNDSEINDTSWLNGKRRIAWKDISKVTFGKVSQMLNVYDSSKKISLHWHLVGFNDFLEKMKGKLNANMYQDALRNYQEVAQRMGVP